MPEGIWLFHGLEQAAHNGDVISLVCKRILGISNLIVTDIFCRSIIFADAD